MPTYEYVCEKCGHSFDLFQSMNDSPIRTCPKDLCGQKKWGKGKVSRQMGAGAGLIFKGSGFYITDYRSQNYKDAAKKDTASSSSSSSASSSSTSNSTTGSGTSGGSSSTPASSTPAPKSESKPKPTPKKK